MDEDSILKVENLSKQYRLGLIGTGTISHDLNRFWAKIRGKEDPYLKIGESNDRSKKGTSEYVWALKDINFEVKRGEVLGIIGKNGAGKSTLLKILSKVTGPTTGAIKSRGRIASLLEVGTGFHPEMTGKENIFLNGAILGMTKKEIAGKLSDIIEFSGCERYINTPVKRYSSGMKVRLAFAVAAFLEPDILIVDEVLAVGDVEFQKKAIGKMQDISSQGGRTVLFVSHDMAAIQSLCTSLMILKNGNLFFQGNVREGIKNYLSVKVNSSSIKLLNYKKRSGSGTALFSDYKFSYRYENNLLFEDIDQIPSGSLVYIDLEILNKTKIERDIFITIIVQDASGVPITSYNNIFTLNKLYLKENNSTVRFEIEDFNLVAGEYYFTIVGFDNQSKFDEIEECFKIEVLESNYFGTGKYPRQKKLGNVLTKTKQYNI